MTTMTDIDIKTFWRAIGGRVLGACVAAARDENGPAGLLALSATHLTATPPMMMMSVGNTTSALSTIQNAGHFSLNILGAGHAPIADIFGGRAGISGADRFHEDQWDTMITGAPTLIGALGVLDCSLEETIERHDTNIMIGRLRAYRSHDGQPLAAYGGRMLRCEFQEAHIK